MCVGRRPELSIFGDDYDTHDGTGVRDYIHVVDLAQGHVAALRKLSPPPAAAAEGAEEGGEGEGFCTAVNLGTGVGVSVLDLVKAMGRTTGMDVPYKMAPRRPGDIASCYCDPSFAEDFLGWRACKTTQDMCDDTWRWQQGNPMGYRDRDE